MQFFCDARFAINITVGQLNSTNKLNFLASDYFPRVRRYC